MPDQSPQEFAREIVAEHNQLTITEGTERLRQHAPHLPLPAAKNLITAALDEKHGVYYIISREDNTISGPYVGSEAARAETVPNGQVVLLLGIGDEANPMDQARRHLRDQLPSPSDPEILDALLDRVTEALKLLRPRP